MPPATAPLASGDTVSHHSPHPAQPHTPQTTPHRTPTPTYHAHTPTRPHMHRLQTPAAPRPGHRPTSHRLPPLLPRYLPHLLVGPPPRHRRPSRPPRPHPFLPYLLSGICCLCCLRSRHTRGRLYNAGFFGRRRKELPPEQRSPHGSTSSERDGHHLHEPITEAAQAATKIGGGAVAVECSTGACPPGVRSV